MRRPAHFPENRRFVRFKKAVGRDYLLPDVSEGFNIAAVNSPASLTNILPAKTYTLSRIRRIKALRILGIERDIAPNEPPYYFA